MTQQSTVDRIAEVCDWILSGYARELRESNKLSQAEVARDVGVTHVAVMRWEKGERRPRGNNALAYHRVLSILAARRREAA
ncbi:helix-turn-helix domain-containing protein [Streptomyces sp. NPDC101152]|uniref:helix-turn-helix domain-containing protein n=1 Tax=Streptomyces sp. NPDC101152 TaxID=3366116 RepID=UPI003824C8C2